MRVFDGMKIEKAGRVFRIGIVDDYDMGAPWKEYDGCGIVRESSKRHSESSGDKRPGERPMNSPGRNEYQFYYDWQASTIKARAEGWGLSIADIAELRNTLGKLPTKGEIIAAAVERDFQYLSGYLNGEWNYVNVDVTDITDGERECDYSHSLGGIENSDDEYILESAHKLVDDILREFEAAEKQKRIDNRFFDAMNCGL